MIRRPPISTRTATPVPYTTLFRSMAASSPAQVKELREKTGAGMMDCKQALSQTEGDMEAAVDWLRKKGLAAAAQKADRVAAEGLVGVSAQGGVGAVVEVNAETDFVARNPDFPAFVRPVADVPTGVHGTGAVTGQSGLVRVDT